MKKKYSDRAINCDPRDGPMFGFCSILGIFGDICIRDNCNREQGGWTNFGYSNSSYEYDSSLKKSLFVNTAGPDEKNYFIVSDYEVFTYN